MYPQGVINLMVQYGKDFQKIVLQRGESFRMNHAYKSRKRGTKK